LIAKYGAGPGTTPEEALESIVNFIAIRRRNLAAAGVSS
jgi:hypothetical protein